MTQSSDIRFLHNIVRWSTSCSDKNINFKNSLQNITKHMTIYTILSQQN